jgi:hypothetical protein
MDACGELCGVAKRVSSAQCSYVRPRKFPYGYSYDEQEQLYYSFKLYRY